MIEIKKLIEDLKASGTKDEEIVRQLEAIKADIDAYLNPQPNQATDPSGKETGDQETAEQKEARIFGKI